MNGRIYDPLLGRFLSGDTYIQALNNLQSYNRYTYVHNNPLTYNDPSGYIVKVVGSDSERSAIWASLNRISDSHPAFALAMDRMQNSEHTHKIQTADSTYPNPGNGPVGDPNFKNRIGGDTLTIYAPNGFNADRKYSAEEVLAHEFFGHGYDKDQGVLDDSINPKTGTKRLEEVAVRTQNLLTTSENAEKGTSVSIRTDYNAGTGPTPVENPDGIFSTVFQDYQDYQEAQEVTGDLQKNIDEAASEIMTELSNQMEDLAKQMMQQIGL